jgi:histidinol phosphatase-like PHP family hydrolase
MLSKNTNPVLYVLNSDNITLNNFKYADSADVLAMVQGERTKAVNILNTDASKAKEKLKAGFGVTAAQVSWVMPQPVMETKKKKAKAKKK